jgi:hypothetical protein
MPLCRKPVVPSGLLRLIFSPKSTLSDRVTGKYKMGSKPGRPPKLSHDDEDKLINHAIEREKLGIGFSKQNFLKFAGDLATKT